MRIIWSLILLLALFKGAHQEYQQRCFTGDFRCPADGKCVEPDLLCDNNTDCPTAGEDEGWTYARCGDPPRCPDRNRKAAKQGGKICRKPCANDSECGGNKQCLCDDVCGFSCLNPETECRDDPPRPENSISYTIYRFNSLYYGGHMPQVVRGTAQFGDFVQYECEAGMYAVGQEMSCTDRGTWSPLRVQCIFVYCDSPFRSIQATGGYMSPRKKRYDVNDTVTFTCPSTHRLLGSLTRTCQRNGRWSGILSVCNHKKTSECPVRYQNFVKRTGVKKCQEKCWRDSNCKDGKICLCDGFCGKRCLEPSKSTSYCPDPGVPINGGRLERDEYLFRVGSTVNFTCNRGFTMRGSANQECLRSLEWDDGGAPECHMIMCDHQHFNPSNGELSCSNSNMFGSVCRFACNDGYRLVGKSMSRCEAEGWSTPAPNCEFAITCDPEHSKPYYGEVNCSNSNRIDSECVFTCNHGYEMVGDVSSQCGVKGWTTPAPRCQTSCTGCDKCGKSVRVTKTSKRKSNKRGWPGQCLVVTDAQGSNPSEDIRRAAGSGSLISDRWVLTTAYIFEERERPYLSSEDVVESTVVVTGVFKLPTEENIHSLPVKYFRPQNVHVHPDYISATKYMDLRLPVAYAHNVALIRIGKELEIRGGQFVEKVGGFVGRIPFSPYIQPVCLPCTGTCVKREHLIDDDGHSLITPGMNDTQICEVEGQWLLGRTTNGSDTSVKAIMPQFGWIIDGVDIYSRHRGPVIKPIFQRPEDDEYCHTAMQQLQPSHGTSVYHSTEFCTTEPNRVDPDKTCIGESGSSLLRKIINPISGVPCWVQIGIASYGPGCSLLHTSYIRRLNNLDFQMPEYNVKVARMYTWIDDTMKRFGGESNQTGSHHGSARE